MSGARRVWTAVAAALLCALTVLLLCRCTVADPEYYTGAVREADGYQRVYDEVLQDPAVRRALRTGAVGIPLRSDAVVDNLPLLVPRPALEQAADRQARALVAALTGGGRPAPGDDWRGPVTRSATEAGSHHLRALRADAAPAAARGLTHLITRLRAYATAPPAAATPTTALRGALTDFVRETWPRPSARRILTALDDLLPAGGGRPAEARTEGKSRPPARGGSREGAGAATSTEAGRVAAPRSPAVTRGDAEPEAGVHARGEAPEPLVRAPRDAEAGGGAGPLMRAPGDAEAGGASGGGPGVRDAEAGGGAGPLVRAPRDVEGGGASGVRDAEAGGGAGPLMRAPRDVVAGGASGGGPGVRDAEAKGGGVSEVAGSGVGGGAAVASGVPGWVPGRGAVVRPVLAAAASGWAVAGVAAAAAGACAMALRAAVRSGRPRARTAAAACGGAAALTAAVGAAVWAALPATAALVPDGLPPSVSALLTDVVTALYGEAAVAWSLALLALTLTATALHLTASTAARRTLRRLCGTPPPPAAHPTTPPAPATAQQPPPRHRNTPYRRTGTQSPGPHSTPPSKNAAYRRTGTSSPAPDSAPPPLDAAYRRTSTQPPGTHNTPPPPDAAPPRRRLTPPPPRAPRPRRVRRAVVALASAAALAQVWALVGVPSAAGLACNGDVELCDRPYDRVVQVGSHNAMATVPDGFLGAHHDLSLTDQLDRGARALLLDTHYWETAERLVPDAGTGGLDAAARATLVRAVDSVVRPRPGTWLCHGPCRMGAARLTDRLRELRDWLEAHPRDVVTLILQDEITPADTARAFRAAGLGPYLHRHRPDPAAPWPTLGEMADSGRRLVVFAEEADGPAPWYRNFYDYAVETPYRARDAAELSCAPHRGGSGDRKRLFLLNHFVTRGMGADRADAAAVNDADVIVRRARTCALLRGRLPTIVAVNHLTLGDAVGAVRRLNEEG